MKTNEPKTVRLNHFILWCKHWYEPVDKDEDVFTTLKKVLSLDGYVFINNKFDSINIITLFFEEFCETKPGLLRISRFYDMIQTSQRIYNKDFEESWIMAIKALFAYDVTNKDVKLIPPTYSRKLFKLGLKGPEHLGKTYTQLNKNAQKILIDK